MESVLHDDDVRSGHTTDTIRVTDQKVHNYRSDLWIALKYFSRVSGGCFTWSNVESICPANDIVRSAPTTDPTKVPDQKVHNYRSDRCISLKLFSRVSGGCFTCSSVESVQYDDDVRSGHTTDTIRVPDQKVHNYRSDRWISLKLFSRVSGGCFTWGSVESVLHDDDVRSGHTTDTIRVPDQKVHNYRSDSWITLKLFLTRFRRLFYME